MCIWHQYQPIRGQFERESTNQRPVCVWINQSEVSILTLYHISAPHLQCDPGHWLLTRTTHSPRGWSSRPGDHSSTWTRPPHHPASSDPGTLETCHSQTQYTLSTNQKLVLNFQPIRGEYLPGLRWDLVTPWVLGMPLKPHLFITPWKPRCWVLPNTSTHWPIKRESYNVSTNQRLVFLPDQ